MKTFFQIAKNRYLLVTVFFVLWMSFFDRNDWVSRTQTDEKIKELRENKAFYEAQIEELRDTKERLQSDDEALEKFAREKFHMRKKGEDVYILVD